MNSFRFMHVADAHIGAGLAHGNEESGINSRLVDFRTAWLRLCEKAVEAEVDMALFAGDGFRDAKPNPTELAALRAGLDTLCKAGIPTLAIVGNHDRPRNEAATNALQIFNGYRQLVSVVSRAEVVVYNEPAAIPPIACLPWPSRAQLAAGHPDFEKLSIDEQNSLMLELLLQTLRGLDAEAQRYNHPLGSLLLAHGSIVGSTIGAEGSTQFLREAVLPLNELRGLGYRYQAFGHLHHAQVLEENIRFSGSIERIDFAEAGEDKGAWIGQIIPGGLQDVVWVSSSPRPFVDIDLTPDVSQSWPPSEIPPVDGAIVRVRYTATPEVARTVDHNAIRRVLLAAGAVKVHGPFANIVRTVTEASDALTEETDAWTGWQEWAALQGLDGPQRERLDQKVREALEVVV